MNIINIITIVFLLILSIIDIKTYKNKNGSIPSVLTTLFLILAFISGIFLGHDITINSIFAFLLALFLTELKLFLGEPDIKVFVAIGMILPSFIEIVYFAIISIIILAIFQIYIKIKKAKELPLIPILLISFLIFILIF